MRYDYLLTVYTEQYGTTESCQDNLSHQLFCTPILTLPSPRPLSVPSSSPVCALSVPSLCPLWPLCDPPRSLSVLSTANLRTKILDFRGFDSSRILISRGAILMSVGNFPESLSHRILAGTILVGRLGVGQRIRKERTYLSLSIYIYNTLIYIYIYIYYIIHYIYIYIYIHIFVS